MLCCCFLSKNKGYGYDEVSLFHTSPFHTSLSYTSPLTPLTPPSLTPPLTPPSAIHCLVLGFFFILWQGSYHTYILQYSHQLFHIHTYLYQYASLYLCAHHHIHTYILQPHLTRQPSSQTHITHTHAHAHPTLTSFLQPYLIFTPSYVLL